jgi:hypothetical protein
VFRFLYCSVNVKSLDFLGGGLDARGVLNSAVSHGTTRGVMEAAAAVAELLVLEEVDSLVGKVEQGTGSEQAKTANIIWTPKISHGGSMRFGRLVLAGSNCEDLQNFRRIGAT